MACFFLKLTVLFVVVFSVGSCIDNATITYMSNNRIKNAGDIVDLECSVHNPQKYPVSWLKIDKNDQSKYTILTIDDEPVSSSSRIYINIYTDKSLYILTITDLEESDSGLYQCQISLPDNSKITSDVELTINKTS